MNRFDQGKAHVLANDGVDGVGHEIARHLNLFGRALAGAGQLGQIRVGRRGRLCGWGRPLGLRGGELRCVNATVVDQMAE